MSIEKKIEAEEIPVTVKKSNIASKTHISITV
jgi:hypothetical protein